MTGLDGRAPPGCYTRLALAGRKKRGSVAVPPTGPQGKRTCGRRAVVLGLLGFLSPSALRAEGVAIDHQAVGCVVAGKYPRLNACFAPRSSLARARVYFRVADAPPDWYYVEMASDAPCHAGILPRPKKELVGRRIQYYVDAFDRSFTESRTPEKEALVVASASECQSKLPVAPILNSATVAVFPGLPAGFAGGAAGLGAGAAAAARGGRCRGRGGRGGRRGRRRLGQRLDTHDDPAARRGRSTTTTVPTTTTTTTTTPASDFNPDFKVFDGRDPRRRATRSSAPSRSCCASTCATRPAPTDALRGRGGRCHPDERVQLVSPSRPSPRARTHGERLCAARPRRGPTRCG